MWKIPHHQQSFLFFQAKPHEKKWSEERTGSASPVPNPDCEKSESYIMFVNSFPNLNRDTFGGGFFRKDLQNWSYFQDSLYVDSYWSVDVRNWEFLPQLQTYKLCTGLRPHQGLNFWFSKSWWETLGRVTGGTFGWILETSVEKNRHVWPKFSILEPPLPSQNACSYMLEIYQIRKKSKHIENKMPFTNGDFRCRVYINSLQSWNVCPVLLLHLQDLHLWHLATRNRLNFRQDFANQLDPKKTTCTFPKWFRNEHWRNVHICWKACCQFATVRSTARWKYFLFLL